MRYYVVFLVFGWILFATCKPSKKNECQWYITKFTPGPIGSNIMKESGPRKEREFIEISTNCKDPSPPYTHINIVVIQSLLTAGWSPAVSATPMPVIIASYNFDGIRKKGKILKNGNVKKIVIGIEMADREGLGDGPYFMRTYSKRSRACSTLQSTLIPVQSTAAVKFLKDYDRSLVMYSIHIVDTRFEEKSLKANKIADMLKYTEYGTTYEKKKNKDKKVDPDKAVPLRLVDSFLADIIRRYQTDVVFFAPLRAGWENRETYAGMFISEYSMATSESVSDDGHNKKPYLVWYRQRSEHPLVLCGERYPERSSYNFEQTQAEPGEFGDNFCKGEKLLATELRATYQPDLLVSCSEGDANQDMENAEPRSIQSENNIGDVRVAENEACLNDEPVAIFSVENRVCGMDVELVNEPRLNECHKTSWCACKLTREAPSKENPWSIAEDDVRLIMEDREMANNILIDLMSLIIFEPSVPEGAFQCIVAVSQALRSDFMDEFKKSWSTVGSNRLVFFMHADHLIASPPHFSAVCCDRTKKMCEIYDSLKLNRRKYTGEVLSKIKTAVKFWDFGENEYDVTVVDDESVFDQDDGTSCALYAVLHMSRCLGFSFHPSREVVSGSSLRASAFRYIEKKVSEGIAIVRKKDGEKCRMDDLAKNIDPEDVHYHFKYHPTFKRELSPIDLPYNEDDVQDSLHTQSDLIGCPKSRLDPPVAKKMKIETASHYFSLPMGKVCKDDKAAEQKEENEDLQQLSYFKEQLKDYSFLKKIEDMYGMLTSLVDLITLYKKQDVQGTEKKFRAVAAQSMTYGLVGKLKEIKKRFKFTTDFGTMLKYSHWLDVHVGETLEDSYFYCVICHNGDTVRKRTVPNFPEDIISRLKRGSSRPHNTRKRKPQFSCVHKEENSDGRKETLPNVAKGTHLNMFLTVDSSGNLVRNDNIWKAFLSSLRRHEETTGHAMAKVRDQLNIKEHQKRDEMSRSDVEVTCTHFRTVLSMTKYIVPLFHLEHILEMQLTNGANVGINLYSRKHGRQIMLSIAEKLRLNLLSSLYFANKRFSLLADSSTSKDAHQYLVVSIRCTLDSLQYDTFFYSIVEIQRERTVDIWNSLQGIVKEDSILLAKMGYTKDESIFLSWFWTNMIGFGSDGGASFAGADKGLQGQLVEFKKAREEPFFYTICMSHRIDLASKAIASPFRNLLTYLYTVTYRYFGSVQNKLLVERYRNFATAGGATAPTIKTIFKVRWVASELAALNNLLRGWKSILKFLEHRRAKEKVTKDYIARARVLETLRFVMEDPRVYRAAVTWKVVLEQITWASRKSQLKAASISSVWPLLRVLESRLNRNAEWKSKELQLLSGYGLRVSSLGKFEPVDSNTAFFGKSAFDFQMRFDYRESVEPKPQLSLRSRLLAYRFATETSDIDDDSLEDSDIESILDQSHLTSLRLFSRYDEMFQDLMDYLQDDDLVLGVTPTLTEETEIDDDSDNSLNPDSKDGLSTTTTAPKIATSARLREYEYKTRRTVENALKDSETPEKFSNKAPVLLAYYASISWEDPLFLDNMVKSAKEAIYKRRFEDEHKANPPFDYLQFEALSESVIQDTINNHYSNLYLHQSWQTKFVPDNWFRSSASLRKAAVDSSVASLMSTFNLPFQFQEQWITFMNELPHCLTPDERTKMTSNPHLFWSVLLNSKCIPYVHNHLRNGIHSMLALPGSTAEVEKSFSIVFHTRGPRRTRMNVKTLRSIMTIRLNVGSLERIDMIPFVLHWMKSHRQLAHVHPQFEKSTLYKFKKRYLDGPATDSAESTNINNDDDDDGNDENWIGEHEEFQYHLDHDHEIHVPEEHIPIPARTRELYYISDNFLVGDKQSKPV